MTDGSNRAAFVKAYHQTAAPLRRYVRRTLGDAAVTEDVVQETFVRALASGGLPADEQEVRAYLFRIASNLVKDRWRRQRREGAQITETPARAAAHDHALRIDIGRVFAVLELRDRQLVWLAHVEGADHESIARVLGVGRGSVKVLLHRARKRFAELLRAAGYDPAKEI